MSMHIVSNVIGPSSLKSVDNETIIRFENVSVRYRVPQESIRTIKEYAIRRVKNGIHHQEFLALNDISLNIQKGEIFGLIGSNGAGKSTLLKLIARVLRPVEGRVWVKGRVAPLLAMGAGFHPELTGRENVFLNGTLLGLSQNEILESFNRIVDFADLWDFIDAPLRTYSSGMLARLAFSVATDKMPDILILDEVLAVGDTVFQEKSLARIHEFQKNGATTLYVTHSMDQVKSMCKRAAWLDHGELRFIGDSSEAVELYLQCVNSR